jgi:hypothetical protein
MRQPTCIYECNACCEDLPCRLAVTDLVHATPMECPYGNDTCEPDWQLVEQKETEA